MSTLEPRKACQLSKPWLGCRWSFRGWLGVLQQCEAGALRPLWASQVSFKDNKQVKKMAVPKRINEIVNRLNKSKREEYPDLAGQRDA